MNLIKVTSDYTNLYWEYYRLVVCYGHNIGDLQRHTLFVMNKHKKCLQRLDLFAVDFAQVTSDS